MDKIKYFATLMADMDDAAERRGFMTGVLAALDIEETGDPYEYQKKIYAEYNKITGQAELV